MRCFAEGVRERGGNSAEDKRKKDEHIQGSVDRHRSGHAALIFYTACRVAAEILTYTAFGTLKEVFS